MTSQTPFDSLVAGEINPNLILSGNVLPEFDRIEKLVVLATLTIGSCFVIFTNEAARLGLRAAFIGVCGDDVFGKFMRSEMSKRNVDVSHIIIRKDGQTGLSVILNQQPYCAIVTHLGFNAELGASDISNNLLGKAHHLQVTSYFLQTKLQPQLPTLFKRDRTLELTTSLDTNFDPSEK